jgi:hypothetical protein
MQCASPTSVRAIAGIPAQRERASSFTQSVGRKPRGLALLYAGVLPNEQTGFGPLNRPLPWRAMDGLKQSILGQQAFENEVSPLSETIMSD